MTVGGSESGISVPPLKLAEIQLLNLSYRASNLSTRSTAELPDTNLKGSINFSVQSKRKYSFQVNIKQDMEIDRIRFHVRHLVRFTSESPIDKEIYDSEEFGPLIMDMLLPFASELFAILSSKSLDTPIIAPSALPEEEPE